MTAPAPRVDTTHAAVMGVCPRSRAKGTRCTSGMKTGTHVSAKVAASIQKVRLRIACARRHEGRSRATARGG